MQIKPITPSISFRNDAATYVRHRTRPVKDLKFELYEDFDKGELVNKLYYLEDQVGHWLKFMLKQYKNGRLYKIVRQTKEGYMKGNIDGIAKSQDSK